MMTPNEIGRKILLLIDYSKTDAEARHAWSPMMMGELAELAEKLCRMPKYERTYIIGDAPEMWTKGENPVPDKMDFRPPTLDARKARAEIATLLAKQKESLSITKNRIFDIMSELSGEERDAPDG